MDGMISLVLLSITMFFGSFLSGLIPLTLTLSESKMRLITVIGAGLLVGTALAVIIPEGVHTLYANQDAPIVDVKSDIQNKMNNVLKEHNHEHGHGQEEGHNHNHVHQRSVSIDLRNVSGNEIQQRDKRDGSVNNNNNEIVGNNDNSKKLETESGDSDNGHNGHNHEHSSTHSSIGMALVIGFVFMLIIDQIGGNLHNHSHAQTLDPRNVRNKITFTTTFGLVIHAAVDGLALGAAATSTQTEIKMIVFIAIMLHKAPASFGLVSFLLHEGLDRVRARRHLLVFALAAPIAAVVTYSLLTIPDKRTVVSSKSTGLCMLFSAGTFLYVSTIHVLPEIQDRCENKQFRLPELLCLTFGAILPLFLSIGHSH